MKGFVTSDPLRKPEAHPLEGLYQSGLQTQAGDYDSIMQQYRNYGNSGQPGQAGGSGQGNSVQRTAVVPSTLQYSDSPDFQKAMGMYSNIARTGGYSGSDVQNLRARGISPIRSIYANAQRNMDRQRTLQGGYSPNYIAASGRMARDLSEQVGQATTNVNASLAEMQAAGRRTGMAGYSGMAGQSNSLLAETARINAANQQRASEINSANDIDFTNRNDSRQLQGIQGQQSLYGTTPALINTFGNQVLNASQQIAQNNANNPIIRYPGGKGMGY